MPQLLSLVVTIKLYYVDANISLICQKIAKKKITKGQIVNQIK